MSPQSLPIIFIIIPTYNEQDCISQIIDELHLISQTIQNAEIRILVFDSNSTDRTHEIVTAKKQNLTHLYVLRESAKSGLGSAYAQAMQYIINHFDAYAIFEFDADGSHQPKYLPAMIDLLLHQADVVVGSRYVTRGKIPASWGWHRKCLSILGNLLSRGVLTWQYKDFTSGFRGTKTEFLRKIDFNHFLSKNYAYKLQLFWELHRMHAKIIEYPIEFLNREKGYSKFPKNNLYESLSVIFTLRLRVIKDFFHLKKRNLKIFR